jgi:ribonucleoside-diphosphate reductase alpha chain
MERIAAEGHIHFEEVPLEVQRVFVTSHDVSPDWHIRMQAAFQEFVDSAISKTCNFSNEATEEDVREIYIKAYDLNCKGVTVYRDGARPGQVLSTGKTGKETNAGDGTRASEHELADTREQLHQLAHEAEELRRDLEIAETRLQKRRQKRSRPGVLRGTTRRMQSPLGDLYVTINEDERGQPFELFCTLGKAGGAAMADVEAIGRLISLNLRSGLPISDVYQQLRGISCDRAVGIGPNKVLSVPDAIAQAIAQHMREKDGVQQEMPLLPANPLPFAVGATGITNIQDLSAQTSMDYGAYDPGQTFIGTCPECSSDLQFMEGCVKCMTCGYSECG